MRMNKYFSNLIKSEFDKVTRELNLNDEEMKICEMLSKDKSIVEISMTLGLSISTVNRRIAKVRNKLKKLGVI